MPIKHKQNIEEQIQNFQQAKQDERLYRLANLLATIVEATKPDVLKTENNILLTALTACYFVAPHVTLSDETLNYFLRFFRNAILPILHHEKKDSFFQQCLECLSICWKSIQKLPSNNQYNIQYQQRQNERLSQCYIHVLSQEKTISDNILNTFSVKDNSYATARAIDNFIHDLPPTAQRYILNKIRTTNKDPIQILMNQNNIVLTYDYHFRQYDSVGAYLSPKILTRTEWCAWHTASLCTVIPSEPVSKENVVPYSSNKAPY